MKYYEVEVTIPVTTTKTLYIEAPNKREAKILAKKWGRNEVEIYDYSGDGYVDQHPGKLRVDKITKGSK